MTDALLFNIPDKLTVKGTAENREISLNGEYLSPSASQKICNHSPDGFNWGYGGSGPAQLALAILLKYLPVEESCNIYHAFKFRIVAAWPGGQNFEETINLRSIVTDFLREKGQQQNSYV